jgi:hypothetical protein
VVEGIEGAVTFDRDLEAAVAPIDVVLIPETPRRVVALTPLFARLRLSLRATLNSAVAGPASRHAGL